MRQYNPIYPSIRKIQSPDAIKVNWVLLNKSPAQNKVIKGEEFVIQATVMPNNALNKRLSWTYSPMDGSLRISSTDRNHQRVTIIANHAGIYYITCTTTDGSNIQNTIQLMVSNSEGEDFKPITSFSWMVEQQSEDIEFSSNSFNTVESDNPITMTFLCNPSDATWKTYNYDFYFTGEDNINNFGYSSQEGNYEGTLPEDFSIDDSNPEQIKIIMPGNLIGAVKITLSALDGSDVTKIFTGTIKEAYIAIQDVTLEVVDNITECDIGDTITCIITLVPANATEFVNGELNISYTTSIETSCEYGYNNGVWTYMFSPQESGNLIITWTATSEGVSGFSKQLQTHTIKVGKVITPMTDSELSAHLSERRFENLLDSSHFESIEEIAQFVREKDFHDIYIGDYIPITIPFTHSSNGSTTQSGSYTVNFRVVDINYLLDKTAASVSSQHLVLMPDNPIGECVMTMVQGDYESELVEIPGSGWYSSYGRGYYNNNMTQNALPKILTLLKSQFGSSHILSFNDSVPIYYSNSYYGGYLTNVQYQSVSNTQIRLPTRITMNGRTLADSNAVWTQQFRLYATDTNYEYISKPAISNLPSQGRSGCLLTDLYTLSSNDRYSSSLDEMFWRIQDGSGGNFALDYSAGPVCPIIIFG